MSKAKWLLMFLLALTLAVPAQAVELTLGGFPSYMRTRARFISNATFISALSNNNAKALGFNDNNDNIFFADTTLRLTPQLVLSDAVTIRAQINVFDNNIWGGATSSTSKTVIIAKSNQPDHDVDYLFGQVSIDTAFVDWSPDILRRYRQKDRRTPGS